MNKIQVVPFESNFIDSLTDYVLNLREEHDLFKICIVFPGKRPSIFLMKSLNEKLELPFIPPQRFSIDEFMEFLFGLKRSEQIPECEIDLIYLLYTAIRTNKDEVYKGFEKITESIDIFVEWGSKILRAMEEIEIEWGHETSIEKLALYDDNIIEWARNFLRKFRTIKERFHTLLRENNLTHRGEVYRYVSEHIDEIEPLIPFEKIIFSGFYALNTSEEKIMKYLFKNNKADIVIQTDEIDEVFKEIPKTSPYYFHQEWKRKWGVEFEKLSQERKGEPTIKFYQSFDTHSEVLNVDNIFNNPGNIDDFAIILPEPSPLIPLLNLIASAYNNDFNITMGYPFRRTSLSNIIKYIFSLQFTKDKKDGEYQYYAPDYLNFIRHPYIKTLNIINGDYEFSDLVNTLENLIIQKNREELKTFFSLFEFEELLRRNSGLIKIFGNKKNLQEIIDRFKKLHKLFIRKFEDVIIPYKGAKILKECLEFIYKNSLLEKYPLSNQFLGTLFRRLEEIQFSLFSKSEDFKSPVQLLKFLQNYLNNTTIPFSGEPLKGIQIMGLLESRNLNFDRVIILDVNEGIIPGVEKYDPLLPQHFRNDIGIPGYTEKESIYAHNFYRLIQGAKDVHLLYKQGKLESTDENIRSRFVERILWDKEKKGEKIEPLKSVFKVETVKDYREFPKNEKIITYLKEKLEYHSTAIDTYIQCPLKFYYRYVLHLKEWEEIEEDIERSTIGIFVHEFLKDYYSQFLNCKIEINIENFMEALTKTLKDKFKENGGSIITREIIKKTLERFIWYEIERTKENDIYIRGLEEKIITVIEVDEQKFKIKGWIDRVEEIEGRYYIIDYKTGLINKPIDKQLPEFSKSRELIRDRMKSLQLPIYIYLYSKGTGIDTNSIIAQFFNLRKPYEKNIIDNTNMEIFINGLSYILKEIINPDIPFAPDNSRRKYCKYCAFNLMCPVY